MEISSFKGLEDAEIILIFTFISLVPPIGGTKDINVNIRIISASSKPLKELISTGKFREDLYHRLNVVPIDIPPLNSRTEDIPLLINYFKKKLSELNGVPEVDIDTKNDLLYTYDWPGNIRELRNLVY